jgi:uncharacterized protein (TIGR04168 family)
MHSPNISVSRLAIVGDLHGHFTDDDVHYFNRSPYDLLLFVGDMGSGTRKDGLSIIRRVARLKKPTLIMPGNNDALHLPDLAAELTYQAGRREILQALGKARSSWVLPVGYSAHPLTTPLGEVTLICGRPLATGGSSLSFAETLERVHGVGTREVSVAKYRHLVADARTRRLMFLAHNGPTGLGEADDALWGRDFPAPAGSPADYPKDFGDDDLGDALAYAKELYKEVLAVFAGHMHRRRGTSRPLTATVDGTTFVNAAVVPRIRSGPAGPEHHHVSVSFQATGLQVVEHWANPTIDDVPGP